VQFLAEALVAEGAHVSVLSLNPGSGHAKETVNGVHVHYVGLPNIYWPFGRAKKSRSSLLWHAVDIFNPLTQPACQAVLREEKPEVVHSNLLVGLSVSAWQTAHALGLPIIHTLRDYYLACPRSVMFANGKNCATPCRGCSAYSWLKRKVSGVVQTAVGNSQHMLDVHTELGFFANAKTRAVVHNIYVPNQLTEKPQRAPRKKLHLGFIGQIIPHKGVDYLIREVSKLPPESYELVIAGAASEEYLAELRALSDSPSIQFIGFVKPESLFHEIDLLVVPSLWHEPLPRVVFEAYSYGVPVLASQRGGNAELVENGQTGFLFEPDHEGELTALIARLISDREAITAMREACYLRAKNFLPPVIAKKYLNLYQQIRVSPAAATI
jgi:glycosyltransferase involved in cell wall biosynthesis